MSLEGHLSPAKAAKATGFPVSTIYAACAAKQLEHVRFSKRGGIHIPESALEAWAAKHRIAAQERPHGTRAAAPAPVSRFANAPSVRELLPPDYEPQFQVTR